MLLSQIYVFYKTPPFELLQRNAVWWWYRMTTRQQCILVCFAFCSTPARSCSEEFFHHSTTPAAKSAAVSPVASGKHPPVSEPEEAAVGTGAAGVPLAEDAEKQVGQTLTSPNTTNPPHFLPVPAAMVTTDTGRRKGRALSESGDPKEGSTLSESGLPATWAPSSNYTTFQSSPLSWT